MFPSPDAIVHVCISVYQGHGVYCAMMHLCAKNLFFGFMLLGYFDQAPKLLPSCYYAYL